MTQYTLSLTVLGKDKVSGMFTRIDRALRSIMQTALGMTLARIFEDAAEAIMKMATAALNAVAYTQVLKITLGSLAARELVHMSDGLLSVADVTEDATEMAAALVHELGRLAIMSPYTLEATTNTYRMMVAFGSTTVQAMDLTKGLLLMGAGLGASNEQIQRMGYNLAQIALQGSVTKLDIRQLALAGLDLLSVLKATGDRMGITIEDHLDFNKALEAGEISWQDFVDTFKEGAETDFAGASEKMARSLYGLKSTLNDVFVLTMPQLLGESFDAISITTGKILDTFLYLYEDPRLANLGAKWGEKVQTWLEPINIAFTVLLNDLESGMDLDKAFGKLFETLITAAKTGIQDLQTTLVEKLPEWFALGTEMITGFAQYIIAGLPLLTRTGLEIVQAIIDGIIPQIPILLSTLDNALSSIFLSINASIVPLVSGIADMIVAALPTLTSILTTLVTGIVAAVSRIFSAVGMYAPDIIRGVGDMISTLAATLATQIPILLTTFTRMVVELAGAIADLLPTLIPEIVDLVLTIVESIVKNVPLLIDAGLEIIEAIGQGILNALPVIQEKVPSILLALVEGLTRSGTVLIDVGLSLMQGLLDAFTVTGEDATVSGADIITALMTGLLDNITMFIEIGVPLATALIDAMIDSKTEWLTQIPPLVQLIIDGLIELAPMFTEIAIPFWAAAARGFFENFDKLLPVLTEIAVMIQEGLLLMTPIFIDLGLEYLTALVDGVLSDPELVASTVTTLVERFITFYTDNMPLMVEVGLDTLIAILEGLSENSQVIIDAMPDITDAIVEGLIALEPVLITAGMNLIAAIIKGFADKTPEAEESGNTVANNVARIMGRAAIIDAFKSVGRSLIQGLYDGLLARWNTLKANFAWIASLIAALFAEETGSESPSTVFMEIGRNLMEGLAIGIKDSMYLPKLALEKMQIDAGVMAPSSVLAGQGNTYNYNLTMPTSNNPQDVLTVYHLVEAWEGA